MSQAPIPKSDIKAYFLVTDKDGMPVIDDLSTLPTQVWETLTQDQKDFLLNKQEV